MITIINFQIMQISDVAPPFLAVSVDFSVIVKVAGEGDVFEVVEGETV